MAETAEVVVGRQGIYDGHGLIGYELLFRSVGQAESRPNGDRMTAAVVFGAVTIGLDALAGDRLIFCNADRELITGRAPVLLPADRTVIEVVETVSVDHDVVEGVKSLVAAGYRIALDDFSWGSGHEALLPLADIVKIDVLATPETELAELVRRCRQHKVTLLAEKIESRQMVPSLVELGFELFQGYALDRPVVVAGRTLAPSDLTRLHTAVRMLSVGTDMEELEAVLRREPVLAYQIMRLASLGRRGETRRTITTINNALVMAGSENVRRWLALLLSRPSAVNSISQSFISVLVRARTCELLALWSGEHAPRIAFTAGMLSALPETLEMTSADLKAQLALATELSDAAFGGDTELGRFVTDLAAYQTSQIMESTAESLHRFTVSPTNVRIRVPQYDLALADAFAWASNLMDEVA